MTILTETRWKCDWEPCGVVSPVTGDDPPKGWVTSYALHFCSEAHGELYFDKFYGETEVEPIVCAYCGKRLNCTDPDFHRGSTDGSILVAAPYGTFRMPQHIGWLTDVSTSGIAYLCSNEHLNKWGEENKVAQ